MKAGAEGLACLSGEPPVRRVLTRLGGMPGPTTDARIYLLDSEEHQISSGGPAVVGPDGAREEIPVGVYRAVQHVVEAADQQAGNEKPEARGEDEEGEPSPESEESEPRAEDHSDSSDGDEGQASSGDGVDGEAPTSEREYARSTNP